MTAVGSEPVARADVWRALSDLYLDQPCRPALLRETVRVLARSTCSEDELRRILFDEVHPVVYRNLCATAGVWDGFDADWLATRILANRRRPRWLRARGVCLRGYARRLWNAIAPRVRAARARTE